MIVLIRLMASLAVMVVVLFAAAGRWNLPVYWAYFGVIAFYAVTLSFSVIDPELREERLHPGEGGTDRTARFLGLPLFIGHWMVAGLSLRLAWPDRLPVGVQIGGVLLLAAALGFSAWAMHVNRFFSPVVRIQAERGHHLISTGPYRFVRHPGYIAFMGCCWGSALALGSAWAALPLLPFMYILLRRTVIEDGYLMDHLPGYTDYAAHVRYRLLPGVW